MITREQARHFAQEWIEAWNAHDLDRILAHYTDDFEMSSPFIATFTGEPSGTLKGKENVRAYWRSSFERVPDLHFELYEVFTGADTIVLYYKSVFNKLATEIFFFNEDGQAYKAMAHYDR